MELEKIKQYLGNPIKKIGKKLMWKCPYCVDSSKDNLIYDTSINVLWCFASGGEHSKMIIKEIAESTSKKEDTKQSNNKPKKKVLSEDRIKYFKSIMEKSNNELLNNAKMLNFLEEKRGINTKTVKDCFIGVDIKKQHFVFPTLEFMTNNIIGFEYRPLDLSKNIKREIGGLTGLAQINQFSNTAQALAILGGYLDCYAFYQHLTEINQAKYYHIATSSNGEGSTLKYLEQVQEHFNKYKIIYLYLDSDNTGIEQMEKIKNKFPFVQIKTMTCGCKDFNEHYLNCIKSKKLMPEYPKNNVSVSLNTNTIKNDLNNDKIHSNSSNIYKIIPDKRKLIANNKIYDIPDYFNIKNAINGDYKTLDYIFYYHKLDIRDFCKTC